MLLLLSQLEGSDEMLFIALLKNLLGVEGQPAFMCTARVFALARHETRPNKKTELSNPLASGHGNQSKPSATRFVVHPHVSTRHGINFFKKKKKPPPAHPILGSWLSRRQCRRCNNPHSVVT